MDMVINSAEDLVSAGFDPATAASLFAQNQPKATASTVAAAVPAAPIAAPLDPAARMQQIIADRGSGKIGDYDWRHGVEAEYTRLMSAQSAPTEDAELSATLERAMAPPADPWGYRLPPSPHATDADNAVEADLRAGFHGSGAPKFAVEALASSLHQTIHTLQYASPEKVDAHIDATVAGLSSMWGDQFDANIAAVKAYLASVGAKNAATDAFLKESFHLFTAVDVDVLLQVATYRKAGAR